MMRYTCMGEFNQDYAAVLENVGERLPDEAASILKSTVGRKKNLTTGQVVDRLIEDGHNDMANLLNLLARKKCGRDLTEIVESFDFDGKVHEYECPACGMSHSVRRSPV